MKTKRLVVTCVLALLANTVRAQLSLLPGDNTLAPAAGDQTAPAIAGGGSSTLVVWSDNRANPYGSYTWSEYETSRDIYGMRLDSAGAPLDAVPRAIVASRSIQNHPKVSWNGSNWLVVYQSVDLGGTGYYYTDSLEAVRVAPDGHVLDPKPIKLYGLTPSGPSYWALASDGDGWVIVNQGTSTGSGIVGMRVSAQGVVLDPPNRVLVPATYYGRSNLKLAFATGVFLFTYDEMGTGSSQTSAVRFDSNLNVLTPPFTLNASPLSDLASSGTNFYAVWNRQEPDFSVHVVGSRLSTAGVKLDGTGANISGTKQPGYGTITSIAWDGVNWRTVWSDTTTSWIARINPAGQVLDAGSVALAGVQTGPIAGTSGTIQLVWSVYTNGNYGDYDTLTASISPSNVSGPSRTLSVGAPQQLRPDVATNGDGYMVVYRTSANTVSRVLAQPLDGSGNALTAEPVQLDAGPSLNGPGNANVAWNGSLYLATWATASGIVAQRLSAAGAKLDAAPFMVMSACLGPADVAALGSDFLVTGRKVGINIQYIFPVAARVSGGGAVLDASPVVLGASYLRTAPAVVPLGSKWLVAWHRNATHDNSSCYSLGAFIDAGGVATPEFQVHGPFSTNGGNGIFEVGLASSGDKALFVQSQELSSGVENDLLCHVINAAGTVGPQVNLTPWVGNQYRPRVAWDGTNFIVAYQDQKNRLALWTLDQLDSRSDLYAMRVSSTGTSLDPQGFVISARATAETDPAITASNGTLFVAGALMLNDSGFANYRIAYDVLPANGPVAIINANATEGNVPFTVNFSSSGSIGDSFAWDFGGAGASGAASPSHIFAASGEYLVSLTVTDGAGRQTVQTQMINATAPNQVPIAVATADVYSGNLPFEVVFSAAQSYDPDGFIGDVEWLFSDGGSYWGSTAYYTFTQPGPQIVTLNCYDGRGGVGSTTLVINADGSNLPPIVHASGTPTSGSSPLTVQFSSAGSSDPDGTIAGFHWDFGDALSGSSNEPNPTYIYTQSGSYAATLTVTDNNGISQSSTVDINVIVQHHVEYGVNLSLGPTHYIEHYEQGEVPVGEILEEDVIAGYGRVAGTANVGFGVNKAHVDLAGTNPDNPLFFEYGFATSRYFDMLQFDDAELNGTHGFFDITLFVAGSGSVDLSDGYLLSPDTMFDAFWHAVINVSVEGVLDPNGSTIQSVFYAGEWYKDLDATTLEYFGDPLNTYQQTATIEFIYGQPIYMDSFLQVDTNFDNQISSVGGTLNSVIDLGNSSYWGGVRNLRDAQGNPVTPSGYSSSSGFDYRQAAVPGMVLPAVAKGDGGIARSRSLSLLTLPQSDPTALRVTLDSLHHVSPPYSGGAAADFSAFEGEVRWVGPPTQYAESSSDGTQFYASQLQCTPYYHDWSTLGMLHVFGSAIVPSSSYSIATLGQTCRNAEDTCTAVSSAVEVATGRWADIADPFNPPAETAQPDFGDITALVAKFKSAPGAPIKARALLAGNDAFGNVTSMAVDLGFDHIAACVDAFRGRPYPYTIQSCP